MKTQVDGKFVYRKTRQSSNITGQAHELTFSCYRNRPFLKSTRICNYLIDAIEQAIKKHHFHLWAYVFMPNHVHLLICPQKAEYSISNILKSIKQSVARKAIDYLKENNTDGLQQLYTGQASQIYRFWQAGGGYDRNITVEKTLIKVVRYIHNNPVRAGLVNQADEWIYSSAKDWENKTQGRLRLDIESWPIH